jgi:uncharacterized membrane protein
MGKEQALQIMEVHASATDCFIQAKNQGAEESVTINIETKIVLAGIITIALGLLVAVHHRLIYGRWWDLGDILHHEWIGTALFMTGIILILLAFVAHAIANELAKA